MADTISALKANMLTYQSNPGLIQRDVHDHLDVVSDSKVQIVDPTNPFVFATEASCVLASGAMDQASALTRKQYPLLAQTVSDLYNHMTDKDYINRFAVPSRARFGMAFDKAELINRLVLDPATGIKKLVLPRNTKITVAGIDFSLQYPIEIRQQQHGGMQVVWDASIVSPMLELETNVIDHEERNDGAINWFYFEFDAYQFGINSLVNDVSASEAFELLIPITYQFYYARAYAQNPDGSWTEIKTTHSEQVYDATTPTVVLKLLPGQLQATIPQIYTSSGALKSKVRVDVYETLGDISVDLEAYPTELFTITYLAIDETERTAYVAPMSNISTRQFFPLSRTIGGSNQLAFEALRQQVIKNNVGGQVTPITQVQLESVLEQQGYTMVKNVDFITNRQILATRPMPTPTNEKLITAAAASIETLATTTKDAVALPTVIDNSDSITITPNTLYQNVNGVIKLVPYARVLELLQMSPDNRALAVSQGNYYYTPFHYVLDMTNNKFASRAYYLDDPRAVTKSFKSTNAKTLLDVATGGYDVQRTATGYKLIITTKSGETFRDLTDDQVFVQLAFTPPGEKDMAYIMGVQTLKGTDGERRFEFDLSTNFNVDASDALQLTKFMMFTPDARLTGSALKQDFQILYATSATMDTQWEKGEVDEQLGRFLLPNGVVGITHESLRIQFGQAMTGLWRRARSVIDTLTYKTWEADVPLRYERDIYEVFDAATGSTVKVVDGEVVMNKLHSAGEVVTTPDGDIVYQHRKGEVMLDGNNNPIPTADRDMLRQIDVMLIEGVYWFATDSAATGYRTELVNQIVSWVVDSIGALQKQALEKTDIFFYPKSTQGLVEVMIGDGLITNISAGQGLRVDLYVTKDTDMNADLKTKLIRSTIAVANVLLGQPTVAASQIIAYLRSVYGSDVIDVEVSGLGGASNLPLLTVTDETKRCSLRKRLVAQADGTLIVEEDVTVNFIRHEKKAA